MAPIAAPFCAEDWYKMVMVGGSNEEETSDHQNETTKKLSEKDLFVHNFTTVVFVYQEDQINEFSYSFLVEPIVFDIVLPPPELTV